MSQSAKPEPPKESATTIQGKAAQWARTCLGWIPGSSYVIGSASPTGSPQTKEPKAEENEKDEAEESETTSEQGTGELPPKDATPETETEPTPVSSETKPEVEEEAPEKEKEEEPTAPVSEEDLEEQTRLKEQTRKVEALRKKFEGVASKLIAVLGKLKHADFKAMPDAAKITKTVAGYRASLKTSLSQSHQLIANQNDEIEAKLKEAEDWAIDQTSNLGVLSARKAELAKALAEQLAGADKVALRGDADDKSDVTGAIELAEKNTAKALAVLDFDKADAEIKRLGVTLDAITKQIEEKFTDFQKRVEGVENGDYARVYAEASDEYQKDMEEALAAAKAPKTLAEAAQKLASLQREVTICDQNIQNFKQATASFPGIEKQYETIRGILPKDLAEPTNAKALVSLQKQLEEEWSELQSYRENNQWEFFSDCVLDGRFPKLLESANELVASDGEAAEAMAAAQEEADRLDKEAKAAAKLAAGGIL